MNRDDMYAVVAEHVTIRFNIASERIDNLKEYFIKLIKRELICRRAIISGNGRNKGLEGA